MLMDFSPALLKNQLLDILSALENNTLSEEQQQKIWDQLSDTDPETNQKLITYLFTGWWIHQHLEDAM
jgi:hypothetical protein